jgi:hypothetical protein
MSRDAEFQCFLAMHLVRFFDFLVELCGHYLIRRECCLGVLMASMLRILFFTEVHLFDSRIQFGETYLVYCCYRCALLCGGHVEYNGWRSRNGRFLRPLHLA